MTAIPRAGLGGWGDLAFFRDGAADAVERAALADPRGILPPADRVYAALRATKPDDVVAVILGQDPYPTPGHANGMAFSVAPDVRPLPRSLANIFRELAADVGRAPPDGDLSGWARQGVLLLNTALTVPPGAAGGHLRLGWGRLADEVLARLDARPRALLLWGKPAQARAAAMAAHHLRIEAPHPSPLSAHRGFFGARPFSRTNAWLAAQGHAPIDWTAPGVARHGAGASC